MPFADSDGIRIHYEDMGEGEPVLLCLPGWCNKQTIFAPLAERLSADHRVLAMDWRGHGDSQASDRDFGFAENALDALAVVKPAVPSPLFPSPKARLHGRLSSCIGCWVSVCQRWYSAVGRSSPPVGTR